MSSFEKGTVVVLTRNHRAQLLRTLRALQQLPEAWPIIVVDNGSTDGTARAVGRQFPAVMLIRSRRDIGAAARNIAVAYAHTPYVAFTHDDSRWEPGALARAACLLDEHASVAVVSACVKEAESGRVHPQCAEVARRATLTDSSEGGPVFGFMPDACVLRTLLLAVTAGAGKVFKRRRVVSPEVAARWSQHHTDVFSGSQRLSPSGSRQSLV